MDLQKHIITRAMRNAIAAQCFGIQGVLVFRNSLMLLYLLAMQLAEARVLTYIAIYGLVCWGLTVPAAFLSDRMGKKRIGNVGHFLSISGFAVITLAAFLEDNFIKELSVVAGIVAFAGGQAFFQSSWFPLLRPIVPPEIRGRYFGKMRMAWQIVGLLFFALAGWLLALWGGISAYQLIMAVIVVFMFIRFLFYRKIPELEKSGKDGKTFFSVLKTVIRHEGYAPFGAYIFLITVFTAYAPALFAMVEKEYLKINPATVVWFANMTMIGSVSGYLLGGMAVDRLGTKKVFMSCHFAFALVLFLFVMRGFFPVMMMPLLWTSHFIFGLVLASSSIAITSEIIALMPAENQSFATALLTSMLDAGMAASGFLCAFAVKLGFLKENWTFFKMSMCNYDALILGFAVMIFILVITLGLVPSVIKKAEWGG
ncbi:MAG: hypothetical protein A2017_06895 [Lentisphaerae bacterium GWF2_44_16]|nr:MAG: hypothetical protein A2017_06895 [Lentisphaerae bacterium GWF2_44_16]